MSTKEDWPRPYQGQKFRDNYDEIFKKGKPTLAEAQEKREESPQNEMFNFLMDRVFNELRKP